MTRSAGICGQEFGPVDYTSAEPDCAISWVRDGRLISIRWTASQDDFGVELRTSSGGDQLLVSSRPSGVIDVDQAGWLDLTMFTLLEMVSDNYDIFRYDPDTHRFVPFGSMNGASFRCEDGGFLVAVGRGSQRSGRLSHY